MKLIPIFINRASRASVLAAYLVVTCAFAYPANCAEEAGACCCHETGDTSAAECCCCAVMTSGQPEGAASINHSESRPVISGDSATCAMGTVTGSFAVSEPAHLIRHCPVALAPASYQDPEFEAHRAPVSLRAPPVYAIYFV